MPPAAASRGIVLPDQAEIPTITGRVVAVSLEMEHDDEFPVNKYDKVLFHPKNAIPVEFEPESLLFVVLGDDVVAVFRRAESNRSSSMSDFSQEETDEDADDFE